MRTLLSYLSGLLLVCTLAAPAAMADFHKWEFSEIFTNADGTVQFIEFFTNDEEQQHLLVSEETVSIVIHDPTIKTFVFGPLDLVGPKTGPRFMLIGTTAFAALPGAPTPDYTIPANFFDTSGGVLIEYTDEDKVLDSVTPSSLPTDGILSWNRTAQSTNSPRNYDGDSGSVDASGGSGVCGNSILEAGEDCDDGNTSAGDCCAADCSFDPAATACGDPSNTACDDPDSCDGAGTCDANFETVGFACLDGDLCNGDELCNGAGSCQVGPSLDCDDLDACTADSCDQISGCANEPIPGCGAPVPSGSLGSRAVLALLMLALATVFLRQRRGIRA